MKFVTAGISAAVVVAGGLISCAAGAEIGFCFEADHPDYLYRIGQEAVMTVAATNGAGEVVSSGHCRVEINNYGGTTYQVIEDVDLSRENPFVLRARPSKPGFVCFRITGRDSQNVYFSALASVGYEPEKIRPASKRPLDFDAFWDNAISNFNATVSLDAEMVKNELQSAGSHDCYGLTFSTVPEGRKIRGQLAIPKGDGPWPITMTVPGAGSGSWGWTRQSGRCYLVLNVLDYPHRPDGDVNELYAEQNRRWSAKSGLDQDPWYFVGDLSKNREDYFYYGAILGINRAVDWVAQLDRVDTSDFRYEGQSQGGAFGIILAALNGHITRAQIAEPALTDLSGELVDKRQGGWPRLLWRISSSTYPELYQNTLAIAPYFDCAHFVPRITIPTRWNVGFIDELCPPHAVYAGYNCLKTWNRMISTFPKLGHGTPSAEYQRDMAATAATWDKEVLPPNAPWMDARVGAYRPGSLETNTVKKAGGYGNWVGSDVGLKARIPVTGTLEFDTEDELTFEGTSVKDLAAESRSVEVMTSFSKLASYSDPIGEIEVPEGAKAALVVSTGNFYGLGRDGAANVWKLLGPAGELAEAEAAVKVVVEKYSDRTARVRYFVGATPETVAQIGADQFVNTESTFSSVSLRGYGRLTGLEGAAEKKLKATVLLFH